MKLIYYILIGFLLLLVSIRAGFAVQEDFNAYATENPVYVCSCAVAEGIIVVENTGDVTSTYGVEQAGTGAVFSSLTEKAFNLEPGESRKITNYISIPCNVKGDFELSTKFKTVFDLEKGFTQEIKVKDCVNVNLKMKEASLSVCPCSPAKYVFEVENTGTFLETYRLGVDSQYAEISEDILILEPQQSEKVTVFITTPCGNYGDLGFTLTAYAESSQMIAELPFVLHVAPCYNYTMEAFTQYSVCQNLNNVIPIKIKNTADVMNTYFLEASADWTIFDSSTINLLSGEEKTANLNVYPADVEPLNYNITIDAVTARGEIRKSLNVATNVEKCYSLNLFSDYDYVQIVNGEKGFVNVYLINDGTRQSEYGLNLTGPEWTSLETGKITVEPSGKKSIKLNYDVPANITGTYDAAVYAVLTNYSEIASSMGIKFDVVAVEDAYGLEIEPDPDKLEVNYDGATIPLTINNVGIRQGEYDLVISGTNWTSLDRKKTILDPEGSDTMGVVLNPSNETPEGRYSITIDAILKDKNIAYSRTFDIKLRQKTLWEKITGFFSNYWYYVVGAVVLIIVLFGAIFGIRRYRKTHPKEERKEERPVTEERFIEKEKPSWLKRILLFLLVLLILGSIAGAAYYFGFMPLFGFNATNITNVTEIEEVSGPVEMPPVEPQLEPVTNATIFVNRTGLRGSGNVIEIRGLENITIPLIIQNNDEPNTYSIKVSKNVSWVRTDKTKLNIPPNKKEIIYLFVEPTPEVEYGDYNLAISIDITGRENPISEEIVLSLRKDEPFYRAYMWYLIGGLAALIVILAILRLKDRKEEEGAEDYEPITKAKEEPQEGKLKKFLVIFILIVIALILVGAVVYFGSKAILPMIAPGNVTINATEESELPAVSEEEIEETMQPKEVIEEIPEENYEEVYVKKGTYTLIPIKISNVNKTTAFKISVKENVTWLYVEEEKVEILPYENKTINLIASPDETIEEGNYKVSVDINIGEGEKMLSKYFILKVRKSIFSDFLSYFYYAAAGLVVLLLLIKIISRKGSNKEEYAEEAEEKPARKKKTDLKLK